MKTFDIKEEKRMLCSRKEERKNVTCIVGLRYKSRERSIQVSQAHDTSHVFYLQEGFRQKTRIRFSSFPFLDRKKRKTGFLLFYQSEYYCLSSSDTAAFSFRSSGPAG